MPDREIFVKSVVLLNISQHATITDRNNDGMVATGFLLGEVDGLAVNVECTCEMVLNAAGQWEEDFFAVRESQCKQIQDQYVIVGWYIVQDYNIQGMSHKIEAKMLKKVLQLIENPILIKFFTNMDTQCLGSLDCGPFLSYCPNAFEICNDYSSFLMEDNWSAMRMSINMDDCERIVVSQLSQMNVSSFEKTDCSSLEISHALEMQANALAVLQQRIKLFERFVQAVVKGELAFDCHIIRKIASFIQLIPCQLVSSTSDLLSVVNGIDSQAAYEQEISKQANDAALSSALCQMVMGLSKTSALIDSNNTYMSRKGVNARYN